MYAHLLLLCGLASGQPRPAWTFDPPPPAPPPPATVSPWVRVADDTAGLHVPIPMACRRHNRGGSDCVWNSLTTLCRYHGYRQGFELDPPGRGASGPGAATRELERLGVPYKEVFPGGDNRAFLREWVRDRKAGCLIGRSGAHAMVLVHFDEGKDEAALVGNMRPNIHVHRLTVREFLGWWDGWAVAVLPREKDKESGKKGSAPWLMPGDPVLPPVKGARGKGGWSLSAGPGAASGRCRLAVGRLTCGSGQGSATVVGPRRPDGRWDVLTAAHCVGRPGARGTLELKDGRKLAVRTAAVDHAHDLAWMETEDAGPADLPCALPADADPKEGTAVWQCGYGRKFDGKVRRGKVTGTAYVGQPPKGEDNRLATDVPVQHGDSGGGLFTEDGLLVGVMASGSEPESGPPPPFGVPFAPAPPGPYKKSLAGPVSAALALRPRPDPALPPIRKPLKKSVAWGM